MRERECVCVCERCEKKGGERERRTYCLIVGRQDVYFRLPLDGLNPFVAFHACFRPLSFLPPRPGRAPLPLPLLFSLFSLFFSSSSSLLFSSLLFAISIFPEISLKREIYSLTLFVINFHVEGESNTISWKCTGFAVSDLKGS